MSDSITETAELVAPEQHNETVKVETVAASPAPTRDSFPKRERKMVEHFKPVNEPKQPALVFQKGKGKRLGDIDNIVTRFSWHSRNEPMFKSLHRVLYHGHPSQAITVKQNILEFSGFVSDAEISTATAKLESFENSLLSEFLSVFDLEVSGTKVQLVERLIEFMKKPAASGRGEPTKGGKRKASSSKKEKKTTKTAKKAKSESKRGTSSFMLFCADERADVVKQNPTAAFTEIGKLLGERWRNTSQSTKDKYMRLAAEKNGKTVAAEDESSESESESDESDESDSVAEKEAEESDDDKPLVDVASQLRAAIRKILKSNDVTTLSVNKIRELLQSDYQFSADTIAEQKATIKEIVAVELDKL